MSTNPGKTHVVSTLMLLAAAVLPMHPLATNGAYRDLEASAVNVFTASNDFTPRGATPVPEVEATLFLLVTPPGEGGGEVAGTTTEPVKVEVGGEPLEVTEEEPVEVETSDEPLEVVETGEETPAPEEETVKEEEPAETESQPEEEETEEAPAEEVNLEPAPSESVE